jgi:DMSO/TMAO reductase YedYZ molybdopterin-dependent catalytic subunit
MSHRHRPSRRRFLERLLASSGLLGLTGCDRLSQTQWFPRVLASAEVLNYRLHHVLGGPDVLAKEYTEADLSVQFPSNGTRSPQDPEYQRLLANDFRDWQLEVGGLVTHPMRLSLEDLRALPARTQITRHDCVEGWSAIAKWKGARLNALLDAIGPLPSARYVVFYCYDSLGGSGAKYYESIDLEDARHPQTLLAYEWNDVSLPVRYGAPLRLRVERQLGYKMAKFLNRIEVVESFAGINGGRGGYWEDRGYAWYAGI